MVIAIAIMVLPVIVSAVESTPPAFSTATLNSTGLPSSSISGIVTNIMNWLLKMVGILGVIGFAISGVLYLTAAGDDDRIKTAKTAMIYSIVGVIVALVGVVVINAVTGMLGGTSGF